MKQLPVSDDSLLIRTDFADEAAWDLLCETLKTPSRDGFIATLEFVSDREFEGLKLDRLKDLAPKGQQRGLHTFAFVADRTTLQNKELPILVVDLFEQPGQTIRVIAQEAWSVENNLSIANMDFKEFASATDGDGVFRGFPTP